MTNKCKRKRVSVYSLKSPLSSADFTIYTPGIGTPSYCLISSWDNSAFEHFDAAIANHYKLAFSFHQVSITVDSGAPDMRGLPNTPTHDRHWDQQRPMNKAGLALFLENKLRTMWDPAYAFVLPTDAANTMWLFCLIYAVTVLAQLLHHLADHLLFRYVLHLAAKIITHVAFVAQRLSQT